MRRSIIVVSATNISNAGPLSVLEDFLAAWAHHGSHQCAKLVVFFGGDKLRVNAGTTVIRTPKVARSWLWKAVFEFVTAARIARRLRPVLWISFQDTVPRLTKVPLWIYCHKPTYVGAFRLRYLLFAPRILVERFVFRTWLYVMIGRSERAIAQQLWFVRTLRKSFRYQGALTVCPPSMPDNASVGRICSEKPDPHLAREFVVIYPAYPRVHKNIEAAIRAVELASKITGARIRLRLTLSGTENLYARYVRWQSKKYSHVELLGFLPRKQIYAEYARADAMLFTSELESWGLPLSEFADTGKPIVAFDWPFVYETLAGAKNLWVAHRGSVTSLAEHLAAALSSSAAIDLKHSSSAKSTATSGDHTIAEELGPVETWHGWREFVCKLSERVACDRV